MVPREPLSWGVIIKKLLPWSVVILKKVTVILKKVTTTSAWFLTSETDGHSFAFWFWHSELGLLMETEHGLYYHYGWQSIIKGTTEVL